MNRSAILFPGQGSQSLGMLKDIAEIYPEIKAIFQQASDVLNYDVWALTQEGPEEKLDQTIYTQPVLLTASFALWKVFFSQKKERPAYLAGHSLGEYTALVCAQALSFTDAVQLVSARGHYMQEATPPGTGALAAIVGFTDDRVEALCEQIRKEEEVLAPANFNSPGQVVVAGHTDAIDRFILAAKEEGARLVKKLSVSVPSHCKLMRPAALRLKQLLDQTSIQTPELCVLNNVDVTPYTHAESIREGLTRQLYYPVRWVETIQALAAKGIEEAIECGPGKVLSGLNKRIVPDMRVFSLSDLNSFQALKG